MKTCRFPFVLCDVCVSVCCVLIGVPMNDPVLQIRLKKQLSGGRAPHLLQEEKKKIQRNNFREIQWAHTQTHTRSTINSPTLGRTTLRERKVVSGGQVQHFLTSGRQAVDSLPTALPQGMRRAWGKQETVSPHKAVCGQVPAAGKAKALSADCHHTYTFLRAWKVGFSRQ